MENKVRTRESLMNVLKGSVYGRLGRERYLRDKEWNFTSFVSSSHAFSKPLIRDVTLRALSTRLNGCLQTMRLCLQVAAIICCAIKFYKYESSLQALASQCLDFKTLAFFERVKKIKQKYVFKRP